MYQTQNIDIIIKKACRMAGASFLVYGCLQFRCQFIHQFAAHHRHCSIVLLQI